jgi:hypothetical protein
MGQKVRVTVIATGFPADDEATKDPMPSMGRNRMSPMSNQKPGSVGFGRSSSDLYGQKSNSFLQSRRDSSFKKELNSYTEQQSSHHQGNGYAENFPKNDFNAAELARFTMDKQSSQVTANPSSEFRPIVGTTDGNSLDNPNPGRILGAKLDKEDVDSRLGASTLFHKAEQDYAENQNSQEQHLSKEPSVDNGDMMDSRIDEALQMVDRLGAVAPRSDSENDNLDIPAFLRSGMRDLSLS